MLSVKFLRPIYRSEGFCVTSAKVVHSDIKYFRTGSLVIVKSPKVPSYTLDTTFELVGRPIFDRKYGWEYEMISWKEEVKRSKKGIINFFVRNVSGVGTVLANKIYKILGDSTISKLDNDPSILVKILGEKKGIIAQKSYEKQRLSNKDVVDLMILGLGYKSAEKAIKRYTMAEIKANPYVLTRIRGIGFKLADSVARNLNIPKNSPLRVKAAILNACEENENQGNCGIALNKLLYRTNILIENAVNEDGVTDIIYQMASKEELKTLHIKDTYIFYRPELYNVETAVAKKLSSLATGESVFEKLTDKELEIAQKCLGITLHKTQEEAVRKAFTHPVSIITGGPGTGKTSILKVICTIYKTRYADSRPALISPTGKAARRMEEAIGLSAKTIHSALELTPDNMKDPKKIKTDLIIVDETSMMDIYLTHALLQALPSKCHIIFVGDADQLPSVGCGAVLGDMISSTCIPTTKLTKIFRQSKGSRISANAALINEGDTKLEYGDDFKFYEESGNKDMDAYKLADLYASEIEKYSTSEVCLLCPQKKGVLGVRNMNKIIQDRLNPNKEGMQGDFYIFREGDVVMQTSNRDWAANGDVGVVKEYRNDEKAESILVEFGEKKTHWYTEEDIDMLILAYAITVHKSQGSEYKSVIIVMDSDIAYIMLKRNLLYTAVTRGKTNVCIIGDNRKVERAIQTIDKEKRMTLLAEKIGFFCSDD